MSTLGFDLRKDANEVAIISRQLEYIKAATYDVEYISSQWRKFIPPGNDVEAWAQEYGFDAWDRVGRAKIIANYADDLPYVDAFVRRTRAQIKGLGDAYWYSVDDLRRTAHTGNRLDQRKAEAARDAIEREMDQVAAVGNVDYGLVGLLNNPNVAVVTPTAGDWTAATTAVQIFQDLNKLVNSVLTASSQVYKPDTALLPPSRYAYLTQPAGVNLDRTILDLFLQTNPYVKNIDQWWYLETANAAGTGPRIVTYLRDPKILDFTVPLDFTQHAPQPKNLIFHVPCEAKVGNVNIYRPQAVAYMDLV